MSNNKHSRISDLDFAESEQSAPGSPSVTDGLPSFLDPSYSGSTSLTALDSPFKADYFLAAGLTGAFDFTARPYGLDAATLPTFGEDGQVLTVDSTLASANDVSFSITDPLASLKLTSPASSSASPTLTSGGSSSTSPEFSSGGSSSTSSELTPRASRQVASDASRDLTSNVTPGTSGATVTITTNLDFTGSGQNVASSPSFVYKLPSSLSAGPFTGSASQTFLGLPFKESYSVSAGLTGGLDVSLGTYSLNYPVTVAVTLPTDVNDGQTFTVDPTLVGSDDATFSMTGPSASLTLALGISGTVNATIDGQAINAPINAGFNFPTSHTFSIPDVPGLSLTIAEPTAFDDSVNGSASGSLPTLTASGSGNNFLSVQADLFAIALAVIDDTLLPGISALDGSKNFGIASLSYSLLSLPLAAGLKLGQTVTLTPEGIEASLKEIVNGQQVGQVQTGVLGTTFQFTAPQTGSGQLQIDALYTANFQVSTSTGVEGDISLTVNGPQISGTAAGVPFSAGPLGTHNFFDDSTGLGPIGSPSTQNISEFSSAVYTINYATPNSATVGADDSFSVDDLLPNGGDIVLNNNATLTFPADDTANSANFSFGNKILLDGTTANFDLPSTSVWNFNGDIVQGTSSPTTLNLEGGGQYWFFSNVNYTGKTNVEGNSIVVFDFTPGLPADVSLASGAQLWMTGASYHLGSLEGSGTVSQAGAGGATVLSVGDDNLSTTFSGSFEEVFNRTLSLTKVGSGNLILTGGALYNGATTIKGGLIALEGSATTLTGDVTVTSPGTLRIFDNASLGSLAGSGNVLMQSIHGEALTVGTDNASTTYSGELNDTLGTGNLVKAGHGALTLTDDDFYHGSTTVSAGSLIIASRGVSSVTASLQNSDVITIDANASLVYEVADTNDNQFGVNAVISGAGQVVFAGPDDGITTLFQANAYTGGTLIDGGIVDVGNGAALGTGEVVMDGGALRATGFSQTLANNFQVQGTIGLGAATNITGSIALALNTAVSASENAGDSTWSGRVLLGANTLSMTDKGPNAHGATWADEALTISGEISGAGGVENDSSGTLFLSGDNTYTGGTTLGSESTLQISADDNIGAGPLTLDFRSTLVLNGDDVTYSVPVILNGAASVDVDDTFLDHFSGIVSGAGALRLVGSGELALDGANTYSGGTIVSGDRLAVNNDDALGTGGLTLNNSAFVDLGHSTIGNAVALGNTDTLFVLKGNIATLNGVISDGQNSSGAVVGGMLVTGSGDLVLNGDNTYSGGTTVNDDTTLSISADDNIGVGRLTLDSGATLDLTGGFSLFHAILLNGAASLIVQPSSNPHFENGLLGLITGAGSLSVSGGGELFFLNGNKNSYTGGTTVDASVLDLNSGGQIGSGALNLEGGASVDLLNLTLANAIKIAGANTLSVGAGDDATLSGVISNGASDGRLIVNGVGALTLTGPNTYSGGTTIEDGAVVIGNAKALGSLGGLVFAGSGSSLDADFTGTILKTTVVDAGVKASIAAGAGHAFRLAGALTQAVASSLSLGAGVTLTTSGRSSLRGTISGAGVLNLSTGSTAINAGANLTETNLTLTGSGAAATLNENLIYGGAFLQQFGTTLSISSGDKLTLTGTSTLDGLIAGAGTLCLGGGRTTINAGAKLTVANWTFWNPGTVVTLNENLTYGGNFLLRPLPTLAISSGDTLTLTGTSTLDGAISGAGDLVLGGGSTTIDAGAKLTQAKWTLANRGTVTLIGNLSYGGTFLQGQGPTLAISSDDTLTLTGTSTLDGAIAGAGALVLSGGKTTINAGAKLTQAEWTLANLGAVTLNGNLSYGGTFVQGREPTLSISSDDTLILTGTSTLDGAISGAGALVLGGGTTTIDASELSQADWTISGAGTTVTINTPMTYNGIFSGGAGAELILGGGGLALNGPTTLTGLTVFSSTKRGLNLAGASTISGLTIAGDAIVDNSATATQQGGSITVGDAGAKDAAELSNQAASAWDIADNSGIAIGADAASFILNAGLIEKTGGTGVSAIAPAIFNTGNIEAASGTLDLKAAVSGAGTGTGTETVSGASTLEFDASVAATQTVDFSGSGSKLLLDAPTSFQGEVSGFDTAGAGSNDTIALLGAWSVGAYTENAQSTGGALALSSGSSHMSLNFLGNYQSGKFTPTGGAGGTTLITFA